MPGKGVFPASESSIDAFARNRVMANERLHFAFGNATSDAPFVSSAHENWRTFVQSRPLQRAKLRLLALTQLVDQSRKT